MTEEDIARTEELARRALAIGKLHADNIEEAYLQGFIGGYAARLTEEPKQETAAENTGGWPDPVRSALETEALTSWAAVPGRDAWLTTARDGYVAGYTIARCTRKDRP